MRIIRLTISQLTTTLIVEIKHKRRIAMPTINVSDILHAVVLPESVTVTESRNSTLRTHASTSKKDNLLHSNNII